MINGPKPYPAYKASGVEWLGAVPEHWDVQPNRTLFREIKNAGHQDEPLLSVTIAGGVIRQTDLLSEGSKKDSSNLDKSKYKLVEPGDIAYNKMRAWQGAIGFSRFRGIVSPAYIVQRPTAGVSAAYMHYLLRTPAFATEAERWSYGITSDQWSLRPEHFKMIYCVLPSNEEQFAIVQYLEQIERKIRRYIRAKQKLIGLLDEQKKAVIFRAVTHGLDARVRLKPSGTKWLGSVPEHWDNTRLKYVASVQTGITLGKIYSSQPLIERPYLRVANVQSGHIDLSLVKTIRLPEREAQSAELRPGDVLMTEGGDIDKLGRGCVWQEQVEGCLHQNHIFAVRPDQSRLLPRFLEHVLGSRSSRVYFEMTGKQTTNLASTNRTTIAALPLALPPLPEQAKILNAISRETIPLEKAIVRAETEVELVRQYRTRLIADVVTGKLDVREAAANLPEETGQQTLEDIDELETEVEETEAEEEVEA